MLIEIIKRNKIMNLMIINHNIVNNHLSVQNQYDKNI